MIKDIILVILFAILLSLFFFYAPSNGIVRYDCSIAEISPDFPIEVRDACRKLRAKAVKNETI
jgi:hypothetical protein